MASVCRAERTINGGQATPFPSTVAKHLVEGRVGEGSPNRYSTLVTALREDAHALIPNLDSAAVVPPPGAETSSRLPVIV